MEQELGLLIDNVVNYLRKEEEEEGVDMDTEVDMDKTANLAWFSLVLGDFRRFLCANKGDVLLAEKGILHYIKWWRSYCYESANCVGQISASDCPIEVKRKKAVVLCDANKIRLDRDGNPIIVVKVRLHDMYDRDLEELTRYTIYTMKAALNGCRYRACDNRVVLRFSTDGRYEFAYHSGDGDRDKHDEDDNEIEIESPYSHKICLIMDLSEIGMSCLDLSYVKRLIYLFARFFVERLGVCYIYKSPFIFRAIWSVIKPWLDEVTLKKIVFCEDYDLLVESVGHSLEPHIE